MENFNRAAAYYPQDLKFQEPSAQPPENSFSGFQQDFSYLNNPNANQNAEELPPNEAKNEQKSGLNLENLMKLMRNSADLSTLASSVLKNQNPMVAQALSKIVAQKKQTSTKTVTSRTDFFEEV